LLGVFYLRPGTIRWSFPSDWQIPLTKQCILSDFEASSFTHVRLTFTT
jgi:hypothetical protein